MLNYMPHYPIFSPATSCVTITSHLLITLFLFWRYYSQTSNFNISSSLFILKGFICSNNLLIVIDVFKFGLKIQRSIPLSKLFITSTTSGISLSANFAYFKFCTSNIVVLVKIKRIHFHFQVYLEGW